MVPSSTGRCAPMPPRSLTHCLSLPCCSRARATSITSLSSGFAGRTARRSVRDPCRAADHGSPSDDSDVSCQTNKLNQLNQHHHQRRRRQRRQRAASQALGRVHTVTTASAPSTNVCNRHPPTNLTDLVEPSIQNRRVFVRGANARALCGIVATGYRRFEWCVVREHSTHSTLIRHPNGLMATIGRASDCLHSSSAAFERASGRMFRLKGVFAVRRLNGDARPGLAVSVTHVPWTV